MGDGACAGAAGSSSNHIRPFARVKRGSPVAHTRSIPRYTVAHWSRELSFKRMTRVRRRLNLSRGERSGGDPCSAACPVVGGGVGAFLFPRLIRERVDGEEAGAVLFTHATVLTPVQTCTRALTRSFYHLLPVKEARHASFFLSQSSLASSGYLRQQIVEDQPTAPGRRTRRSG